MGRRILYIEPTPDPEKKERLQAYLRQYASPGTEVQVESLIRGTLHLEYLSYSAAAVPEILARVQHAEQAGFDAAIIGCFYDPGLFEAREISRSMPVTAPAESALRLAVMLGHKFSIIVGRRKWIPTMEENVRRYGLGNRLASFKPIGMGVEDFHRDPEETERRLIQAARSAVLDDGAEVMILGCTMQLGFFRKLQDLVGVPVIDVAVAALKQAEHLIEVGSWGWVPSKVGGYETPPDDELAAWNLPELLRRK